MISSLKHPKASTSFFCAPLKSNLFSP